MSKSIKDLNILSQSEKETILYKFNDTAVDYPRDKRIYQLFEEQVIKTPDKTAVIACDKTLTYRELNEQSNRIAHNLIERGVKPGDIVAFKLPRRSYLIATMFGILKAGAAYMPIDPDYPQDRIEYMLSDSKAIFCVTEDNISDLLKNESTTNPNISMTSDNLCYCIYTSGSTGKPKGTVLRHRNVVNYLSNSKGNQVVNYIKTHNLSSVLSVTTVGFDIFGTETLMPSSNGLQIILANEEQSKFQNELNSLLSDVKADVMQTTPTKMKMLIGNGIKADFVKNIKVVILGGEALDKALVEKLQQITQAKIFNIYGPTETTVWSTNGKISHVSPRK